VALELFWAWTGVGLVLLLTLLGALVLMIPGRLVPAEAERLGMGRHVEALILVAALVTVPLLSLGNVPIYVGRGGVVAVSLLGAIVPTILAVYFLVAAGPWRMLLSLPWIALASVVAFHVSEPVADMGIVAQAPGFYLPAIAAAVGGTIMGWRSLRALPLAYAYGVLGGLIGADLLRLDWILSTPLTAASIGGAEARDLVFLLGLWAAALAAIPLLPQLLRLRRGDAMWAEVARLARVGEARAALELAVSRVESSLAAWRSAQRLDLAERDEVLERSTARPVFAQADFLRIVPEPWNPAAVRRVLENLEGLERRLLVRPVPDPAPRLDRVAAALIDLIPILAVGFLAGIFAAGLQLEPTPTESPEQTMLRTFLAQIVFVVWTMIAGHVLLMFFVEWLTGGESLGKRLLGLRVRHVDGGRPGGWDLFVRNIARLLDMLVFYLIPFVAREQLGRQRLGDHFAQTFVQRGPRSRRPVALTQDPPPPEGSAPAPWVPLIATGDETS
jgi:uncharacterized RDD family membrane protein YckC